MKRLARIMHRFSSRSAESAGLTRRATEAPRKRTVGYAEEADRAQHSQETSDFGDAVENLCIIRARTTGMDGQGTKTVTVLSNAENIKGVCPAVSPSNCTGIPSLETLTRVAFR